MPSYPMTFRAAARATDTIAESWSSEGAADHALTCAIPAEFGGPQTGFSPEDLFVMSLINCFVATFKVIAANSKLAFASLEGTGEAVLDRDESAPTPFFKTAKLNFRATGVTDVDRFRRLMERVAKQCMIINSVRTAVEFDFIVEPA